MHVVVAIVGIVIAQQSAGKPAAPRLNVRAERGFGGVQTDGWQHIALRLDSSSGQPVTGRAILYELQSKTGARARISLPIEDRKILHFYPFCPKEALTSSYVITLEDDAGRPIPFDGGSQVVIGGQSTHGVRVESSNSAATSFKVAIWGDVSTYFRTLVGEWSPSIDEASRRGITVNQWQQLVQSGQMAPEAITVDDARMFPDSYIGFGELELILATSVDFEQLTERQRRALEEWVQCGGKIVVIPANQQQLCGPFMQSLAGVVNRGEVTTQSDGHLPMVSSAGTPHQIVHFLSAPKSPRGMDVLVSYDSAPVVYSVAAGYGRVWIVGFDPNSHGGMRRYQPLWISILNQVARANWIDSSRPSTIGWHDWGTESDSHALSVLGERFGKSPSIENLAALILGYLLVIGPVNFVVLKRREARVWLIGTVPVLAAVFGGIVLCMGYVSHGVRAAINTMGLAVVTPEGTRAFASEQVAMYGATSAEYAMEFPRQLAIRPLGEYVPNPEGGFEHPGSFRMLTQDEHQWLRDWRLTFWQTRATSSVDCVTLGGRLIAELSDGAVTISNETEIPFESVVHLGGQSRPIGALKPFDSVTIPSVNSDDSNNLSLSVKAGAAAREATKRHLERFDSAVDEIAGGSLGLDASAGSAGEVNALMRAAVRRIAGYGGYRANGLTGDWVIGLTRQPIHSVRSPDAKRQYVASVYIWPVASR